MWRVICFLKKYQSVNVYKHKVNCFRRFVNRFIIDSCSSLSVTKHAYQRNYISPLFPVNLLPSDFKINIHNCINIYMYMYIIFDGNFFNIVSPYQTINYILLFVHKFFWFRSAKYQYPCWYSRVLCGTKRNRFNHELYSFLCFWNYSCKNMFLFHNLSKTFCEPFKIYM